MKALKVKYESHNKSPEENAMNDLQVQLTIGIDWEDEETVRNGMTLVAIMGIQDPVRPEVIVETKKSQNVTKQASRKGGLIASINESFRCQPLSRNARKQASPSEW